jgi:GH18 family chitinase
MTGDAWADTDKNIQVQMVFHHLIWNDETGLFGNFGQFKKLLDNGRKINITLSLGGWTWEKNFHQQCRHKHHGQI